MRKNYLILLFLAIVSLGFTACKDDDKDSGSKSALNKLQNNQVSFNGEVFDVNTDVSVNPANNDYVGAHFIDITAHTFSIRIDLGTPLIGKSINLVNPLAAVGANQLSIYVDDADYNTYYYLDCFDDYMGSSVGEGKSGFSDGVLIANHDSNGFTLTLYGTISDGGGVVAIKAFVSEADVNYWNQS